MIHMPMESLIPSQDLGNSPLLVSISEYVALRESIENNNLAVTQTQERTPIYVYLTP
ncbi:MAG: hypothetical protein GJ671_03625 [Alteromonadaceae bacterium]|nr:hypothetical protein [Alteromonadaceae bacterium]